MKINGDIIKKMREGMGMTRDDLAERVHISAHQLGRLERGENLPSIWQMMEILEMLGQPSDDFWLLYLEAVEFDDYRIYRQLKREIGNNELAKAKETHKHLENSTLAKQHPIAQYLAYTRICLDESLPHPEAIEALHEALLDSWKDFDMSKIHERRLTYNEIYILNEIASRYSRMGDHEKAINIMQLLIDGRESSKTSEDDRAKLFPALMFNLSNHLGKAGRLKEAQDVCEKAIKVCREYNSLRVIPKILLNLASCLRMQGEEKRVWEVHLFRAYYAAYAHGSTELGKEIKENAEKNFGVVIKDT